MKENKKFKRIVIKFGTQDLMRDGKLCQRIFNNIARQINDLLSKGIEVVIVSSGAIQAGRERLKSPNQGRLDKKDIAGAGMRHLLNMWGTAFVYYSYEIVQVLVTHANWRDQKERSSIKRAILNCMQCGLIPVINENDIVSNAEILLMEKKISENDQLAAMVAKLIRADAILFLTEVGGIYSDDPSQNRQAKLYNVIDVNSPPPELKISKGVSQNGRGGMLAKFKIGSDCAKRGIYTVIAGLKEEDTILKFACQEDVGTRLVCNKREWFGFSLIKKLGLGI